RILGSRREAEDILHDVFVEVWKRASDFDANRGSVKTWLAMRMRCRCLDRVRSAGYSRARPLSHAGEPPSEAPPPTASSDAETLRGALDELPEEQRTVLLLGYFEGLSSREIAERTGVPVGTVKSRVAAAMAKLRATLGVGREQSP